MRGLDEFISSNKDRVIRVTKLKALPGRNMYSGIGAGEGYQGQASLRTHEEGVTLNLDGGYTMRTSLLVDAVQKSPTRWLVKTMNSVYRVEVIK